MSKNEHDDTIQGPVSRHPFRPWYATMMSESPIAYAPRFFGPFLFFALAACADDPDLPPPPVGPGGGGPSVYEDAMLEEETPCDTFLECAVECGDVEFGAETWQARRACIAACDDPGVDADLLDMWGRACAGIAGNPDLCDQGYDFCLTINNNN